MTEKLFVEIRSRVQRSGPPRLVPLEEVGNYRGFRSIVAYPEPVANFIKQQGTTKGLRGVEVYADTLFMDFDNTDPSEFEAFLLREGYAFDKYDSGNRSDHYHIPLEPIQGPWVPTAMRNWVKRHAPNADISFYHWCGQYRLPGTFHYKKPGQYKRLVAQATGKRLVLIEPERKTWVLPEKTSAREDFYAMLMKSCPEGQRRPWVWRLATVGAEAGMSYAEVSEELLWWNQEMCVPPHEPDVIIKQIDSAFRRVGERNG